jgi:hypothetical protein
MEKGKKKKRDKEKKKANYYSQKFEKKNAFSNYAEASQTGM